MKRPLFALSLALGLACAGAPALAQDNVHIDQSGNDSTVAINQVASGGGNSVMVMQGDAGWGYYAPAGFNNVRVNQVNVAGAVAEVTQSGMESSAYVEQMEGGYSMAKIMQTGYGGMNLAEVYQTGHGNSANIEQAGSNLSASIRQAGYNNTATVLQRY
ncbi:MAG: hypothetical protein ACJ8LG_19310 [Massilia sp.]